MKRSVWNVGNNKKKGSWKQATVGLMLIHCDYAETTIIIIILLKIVIFQLLKQLTFYPPANWRNLNNPSEFNSV